MVAAFLVGTPVTVVDDRRLLEAAERSGGSKGSVFSKIAYLGCCGTVSSGDGTVIDVAFPDGETMQFARASLIADDPQTPTLSAASGAVVATNATATAAASASTSPATTPRSKSARRSQTQSPPLSPSKAKARPSSCSVAGGRSGSTAPKSTAVPAAAERTATAPRAARQELPVAVAPPISADPQSALSTAPPPVSVAESLLPPAPANPSNPFALAGGARLGSRFRHTFTVPAATAAPPAPASSPQAEAPALRAEVPCVPPHEVAPVAAVPSRIPLGPSMPWRARYPMPDRGSGIPLLPAASPLHSRSVSSAIAGLPAAATAAAVPAFALPKAPAAVGGGDAAPVNIGTPKRPIGAVAAARGGVTSPVASRGLVGRGPGATPGGAARARVIKVVENGEYAPSRFHTSQLPPCCTVAVRPVVKSVASLCAVVSRELQWNSMGRRVEMIFDAATGEPVTSIESLRDGVWYVASGGHAMVPIPAASAFYRAIAEAAGM